VEGHALSLHFPSVKEANDFRRNLLAAGLITATLAVGAGGGMAIASAASGLGADDTAVVTEYAASNLGQYDTANMGGTFAPAQATSLGQADPNNMGGTIVPATSLGQADPTNMGGTIAPASSLGQADPTNMGGTPQANAGDDEDDAPQLPPGI
jgi:hypothetical protein